VKTLLLTGFEPFSGCPINVSWEVASALDGEAISGWTVAGRRLPVRYGSYLDQLHAAMEETGAKRIVSLGQANTRSVISVEVCARNLATGTDEDSYSPPEPTLEPGGPEMRARFEPVDDLLFAGGMVPIERSEDAGTFLCNATLYRIMQLRDEGLIHDGLFLHLPPLPGMVADNEAAWSVDQQADSLRRILLQWLPANNS
jgi:pyrrolidone-carboxylate peptidase